MKKNLRTHGTRRGSTLLAVMLICISLSLVLGTLLHYCVTEYRLNHAAIYQQHARNAAETLVEYGMADVIERFKNRGSLPTYELKENPIEWEKFAESFLANSKAGKHTVVDYENCEVVGGIIQAPEPYFVNPKDPANETDPLKGKEITIRKVSFFSKATTKSPTGGTKNQSTAHTYELLHVRNAPLFGHAIFYGMDLEFYPEEEMHIYGPVHSNGDIFFMSGDSISFHEPVTAHGHAYHGAAIFNGEHTVVGDVYFANYEGNLINMKNPPEEGNTDSNWYKTNAAWMDSRTEDWEENSLQRWDGGLMDQAHDVPTLNPLSRPEHEPDDPYTTDVNELKNYGYAMIEPVVNEKSASYKGDLVRSQKLAYKAGLILKVEETYGGARNGEPKKPWSGLPNSSYTENGYRVRAYAYEYDTDGEPKIGEDGNPILNEVKLPSALIGDVDPYMDYIDVDGQTEDYDIEVTSWDVVKEKKVPVRDEDGQVVKEWVENTNTSGTDTLSDNAGSWKTVYETDENGDYIMETETVTNRLRKVTGGMNDRRQNRMLDVMSLDVSRLVELVDDTSDNYSPGAWKQDAYSSNPLPERDVDSLAEYNPAKQWNGIVYVEFPTDIDPTAAGASNSREDQLIVAKDSNTVLQVINGEKLPNPSYSDKPVGTVRDPGFSLITNAPLYVLGNYNADGVAHENDSNAGEDGEIPALLAADAVTILSENWKTKEPGEMEDEFDLAGRERSLESAYNRRAAYTEISAAILTGLVPTIPSDSPSAPAKGAESGGAHNFPRLLENWQISWNNYQELTIRGSLVALFESEVHNAPLNADWKTVYLPPVRDWGFHDLFRNGSYPPGSPNARTYRRAAFRDITASEYEEAVERLWEEDQNFKL